MEGRHTYIDNAFALQLIPSMFAASPLLLCLFVLFSPRPHRPTDWPTLSSLQKRPPQSVLKDSVRDLGPPTKSDLVCHEHVVAVIVRLLLITTYLARWGQHASLPCGTSPLSLFLFLPFYRLPPTYTQNQRTYISISEYLEDLGSLMVLRVLLIHDPLVSMDSTPRTRQARASSPLRHV